LLFTSKETGRKLSIGVSEVMRYRFGSDKEKAMKRQRRLIAGKEASGSKTVGMISDETSEVERLMREFESHETHEAVYVRRYREIFERMRNPLIKFLVELILADEEKHHTVLQAMASTLKGSVTWTRLENAIEGLYNLGEQKDEILKVTEDFMQAEKKEIVEYRKLMRASKTYYQGLFTLFLSAMIHDSEKHVEILEFLRNKLKAA
jgi:bacterioferritin (cytochrome b1)